ncbi:hypothetical protein [Fibrivirga algicola]|nr:hypothetical protein [Fibrivirga algicola]
MKKGTKRVNQPSRRRPDWLVIMVCVLFLTSLIIGWFVFVAH